MSNLLDKWNGNKFSVYDSEEKTVLELIEKSNNFTKEIIKEVDNKVDQGGNFTGSWQGIAYPTLSEEGLRGIVEQNQKDIATINKSLNKNVINFSNYNSFDNIFNNFDSGTINIDKDVTLTETLVLPTGFDLVSYNGSTITSGDFNAISITENIQNVNVSNVNNNVITVISADNFKIGDTVGLYPLSGGDFGLVATVNDVNYLTKKVTLSNMPFNVLGTSFTLMKMTDRNQRIEGIRFTKSTSSTLADIQLSYVKNVIIKNCLFDSCNGITLTRSCYCNIENNSFYNTGDSTFLYDSDYVTVKNNKYNIFGHGVRMQYANGHIIIGNELNNGTSKEYSTGIEVTGENLNCFKSCHCLIENNKVNDVNIGVEGSAIGGIHLNFNAHHNIIKGNIVTKNGIGIYLENYCENNTIDGNISSYNGGWYGVGIELDWNSHNNKIVNNTCEYNDGNIIANESCGIQVRVGKSDETHQIVNTIVSNNVCRYNGRTGIYISGRNTICIGNICEHNGTNTNYEDSCDILILDCIDSNCSNNSLKSSVAKYSLVIKSSERIVVSSNNIITSGISSILSDVSNYIRVLNNNITFGGTQRGVQLKGTDTTNKAKGIYFMNNIIFGTSNGYPTLEFTYVDTFCRKYNDLITNTNVITYETSSEVL